MNEISIKAEQLFHIGSFAVTNSLLLAVVTFSVLTALAIAVNRKQSLVPGFFQNFIEILIEKLLGVMDAVFGKRNLSEKYFPLIATVFVFVMFSNWLGLLPGVGSIIMREGEAGVPILRAPSADLNFTIMLAIVAVLAVNIFGVAAIGFRGHFKKFFNFSSPILFFTGILELISEFVKIISFSFRLFGNVFAGEVLLTIIGFLLPYAVPLPFLFLEIFVGFIQAFIFSMLLMVFIAMSVSHESAH